MIKKINILDDLTINKIAAGEVVERPSSVVKELVENAIDANSSKITIEIQDGGKKLIRITDNGEGIASSQVEKSFLRHATSKITKVDDLYNLYSLGFRGEALASISSISRIEIITRTKDEPIGTKMIVDGGKLVSKEPVGTTVGTTIIVKDLFFNTPARQKFLKSSNAENMNISDLVNKLAIGNCNIQFKYINNNKVILNTPGDTNLLNTIRSVYGKEIYNNLIAIDIDNNLIQVDGYIGNNNIYRANRSLQHIYVNKRYVKSKVILDAIYEAYKSIIPINKHTICFLNISLDPSKINVNIHPTKLEIKFEKENDIYITLRDAIKNKLLNSMLFGKYETPEINSNLNLKPIQIDKLNFNQEDIKIIEENKVDIINDSKQLDIIDINLETNNFNLNKEFEFNDFINLDKPIVQENLQIKESTDDYLNNDIHKHKNECSFKDYKVIGTLFKTYIVLEKGSSLFLLDQHAAHERILYEKYMDKFNKEKINMQLLLDPIVLEVSSKDMLLVEENLDLFLKLGFEVEIFGNNHIMVRSVPNLFGLPQSEKFILDIIDNMDNITSNYELKKEKIASMACKSAIKAHDHIHDIEIDKLIEELEKCINSFTCPHGRPIIVELSKYEIEKMFKRIM
jgi:DNA mismatch repair protein MutL